MAVRAVVALTAVVPLMTEHSKSEPYADVLMPMVPVLPALFFFLSPPVAGWIADPVGRPPPLIFGPVASRLGRGPYKLSARRLNEAY